MDKLKYVKLENPDGSYSDSIPLSVSAEHVDIASAGKISNLANYISANDANVSNLKTQANNNTSAIQGLASGSPKGSYETVAALVSANPKTGVYIISENGHIYSWEKDNSNAIDLGVYQATAISNGSIESEKMSDNLKSLLNLNYESINTLEWELGGISLDVDKYHQRDDATDRIRSIVKYVKAGTCLSYDTSDGSKWKICKFSDMSRAKSWIGDVGGGNGVVSTPSMVVEEDCFIIIVIRPINMVEGNDFTEITSKLSGVIFTEKTPEYEEELFNKNKILDGFFLADTGKIQEGTSGSGFDKHCVPIEVEVGKTLILKDKNNSYADNMLGFYDKYGDFIECVRNNGTVKAIVPENAKYIRFNIRYDDLKYYTLKQYEDLYKNAFNVRIIQDTPKVKLIAHRGYNNIAPEATVPAYELAGKHGFWGCKIDICETADRYFVCSHDKTVDRMFDGTGTITSLKLAQIEEMTVDSGVNIAQYPNQKIVRLEKALAICKKYGMHPYIEFKQLLNNASVNRVWKIIKSYGLENSTLVQCSGGIKSYLTELRKITDLPPIIYWNDEYKEEDVDFVKSLGNATLSLNSITGSEESVFETYVQTIKDMGMPVCTAICYNEYYAKKWIEEYGLDLIVTANITYEMLEEEF